MPSYFTPCNVNLACEGDPWYAFDKDAAKALLAEAGFPNGFSTHIYYRDVVRDYLPDVTTVATDLQKQLKDNLNITADLVPQESGTFLDNSSQGLLDGLYLLGWSADYPDPTNFLDYHFNNPSNLQFGKIDTSITDALKIGAQTLDEEAQRAAYVDANNAIKAHAPMIPIAHGTSATAFKADVAGAHSSPFAREDFSVMDPGTLHWCGCRTPTQSRSTAQMKRTERRCRICDNMFEQLYKFQIGETEPTPQLATGCEANAEGTVWTCTLQGRREVPRRRPLRRR